MITPLQVPASLGEREVITKVGDHIVQGVYSTYVGTIRTKELKRFLTTVIDNHHQLQTTNHKGEVWTMGDFNLKGVAPGHHNEPRENSQRYRVSQWMKGVLKAYDLQGVTTPDTHTTGSALDIHITRNAERHKANIHTIAGRFSDHSVSIVETNLQIEVAIAPTESKAGHTTPHIIWTNKPKEWEPAITTEQELLDGLSQMMEATTNAVREKRVSPKSYKETIDLATLIVHAALVTIGHRYKLVTTGKIIKHP